LTFAPAPDVLRRHAVGVTGVATPSAFEDRLSLSVRFLGVPALRALARGVARVDFHHRNTGSLGFVLDVAAELMEGPAAQAAAHRAAQPCPSADALQVLEGYRAVGAFGTLHQFL